MEILSKLAVSAVIAASAWGALHWVWTHQLDIPATIAKYWSKKPSVADMFVTRDDTKIYQNGKVVGEIDGDLSVGGGRVTFHQLVNVNGLDVDKPIEYKYMKLKFLSKRGAVGMMTHSGPKGTSTKMNVLVEVQCEEIKD